MEYDVEGEYGGEVDGEPALQVVLRDQLPIVDLLVVIIAVRGKEAQDQINQEEPVDRPQNELPVLCVLLDEGNPVWHQHAGVEEYDRDEYVPVLFDGVVLVDQAALAHLGLRSVLVLELEEAERLTVVALLRVTASCGLLLVAVDRFNLACLSIGSVSVVALRRLWR